tara:strand:- start:2210 stop:2899 length:690 start_codon:yes stop_codon:yes gene_type:complete
MEKKGELTSKQLITIIILVVSFAIIIAFFFMLNFRGQIDQESCRNSVMMKGAIPIFKGIVSLKCKTQDICLSMGGDCERGEEIKVDSETELYKEMADLMADCWWMMGEGKVNYGKGCAVCYKVYFDDGIKAYEPFKKKGGIPYSELYQYMSKNIVSEEKSYLNYFYGLDILSVKSKIKNENKIDIDGDLIDLDKNYAIVTKKNTLPLYVEFNTKELIEKTKCSSYVTEA